MHYVPFWNTTSRGMGVEDIYDVMQVGARRTFGALPIAYPIMRCPWSPCMHGCISVKKNWMCAVASPIQAVRHTDSVHPQDIQRIIREAQTFAIK